MHIHILSLVPVPLSLVLVPLTLAPVPIPSAASSASPASLLPVPPRHFIRFHPRLPRLLGILHPPILPRTAPRYVARPGILPRPVLAPIILRILPAPPASFLHFVLSPDPSPCCVCPRGCPAGCPTRGAAPDVLPCLQDLSIKEVVEKISFESPA